MIVSGGQTGADRSALDWAIARHILHGGWCPAGRLAEDGKIGPAYNLKETPEAQYLQRTEWNVRDSDGTVVFSIRPDLSGGSLATMKLVSQLGKPGIHLFKSQTPSENAAQLSRFIRKHEVKILNVAGPRASGEPQIRSFIYSIFDELFKNWE